MNSKCENCRFAKIIIPGLFLDAGQYSCSLEEETNRQECINFQVDTLNEGLEYSFG